MIALLELSGPHPTKKLMVVERIARSGRLLAACGLLFFLSAGVAWGQETAIQWAQDARRMRAVLSSTTDDLRRPAEGVYDVVALRVEFQPDTSRFTTGGGTFDDDLYGGIEPALDPLPHDAEYFEAHLDFLRDYVERASDDIVSVRTHLLPEVIQVSGQMGSYAPTGPEAQSDQELSKLAALVKEAWSTADEEISFDMSGLVPEKTAFLIFHAGVGRDVELIGTTLDKTPEDLPSLFFDERVLGRLGAADITFNGFDVDHTMILPRTESRLGTDFIADEPFLLELSINGLLAASFFNFLGVPDLFDTETGESAIGPFGLMDAQGIFAYRGLFPPEPMAWTKLFLGWTDPVQLEGEDRQTVSLDAASELGTSASAQAPVSDAEYFLVENRYRDPEHDGLTLRVWRNGSIVEQHVENGDLEFNSQTIEGFIGGVVVGVDNYDWALPGGLDENENPLNGGILIWHIDERRLRSGLPGNTVNVGAASRAIDLEEADSAQDIGFRSGVFGPQAELGTPFDFFFEGNPVMVVTAGNREIRLYENRFGPDTYPNSETNAGGPSFIMLEAFSSPAEEMTFAYELVGVEGIDPVVLDNTSELEDVIRAAGLSFGPSSSVTARGAMPFVYSAESSTVVSLQSAQVYPATTQPVITADYLVALTTQDAGPATLRGHSLNAAAASPAWSVELPAESAGLHAASPLVQSASGTFYAVLRDSSQSLLMEASPTNASLRSVDGIGRLLDVLPYHGEEDGDLLVVGTEGAGFIDRSPRWSYSWPATPVTGRPVFGTDAAGLIGAIPLTSEGEIQLLLGDGNVLTVDVSAAADFTEPPNQPESSAGLSPHPLLADLDADGYADVLVAYNGQLFAFSQSGAVVRNFPKQPRGAVVGQPLVARFDAEDEWTIVAASTDGYLYAYDKDGLRIGFPLEVGNAAEATPLLTSGRLYAVSEAGTVKVWEVPSLGEVWWGELHRDAGNARFVEIGPEAEEPGAASSLIDESETYNWPNPIENGTTHLRIRTTRDASVEVTIIDAGGALIENVDLGLVRGGISTEVEWQTDVESGLYFARFTALANGGERETKVVKMAVVR